MRTTLWLLAQALTFSAGAAQQNLVLDPTTTEVSFTLPATGHDVHGLFKLREAVIRFDDTTGTATGEMIVDAASGETGNNSRDNTMRSKVLESGRFPLVVFTAERLEGSLAESGQSQLTLHGTLRLHGDPHPFALPATVVRQGNQLTVTCQFEVPFLDWGLKDPSIVFLRVGKSVAVTVKAQGKLEAGVMPAGGSR